MPSPVWKFIATTTMCAQGKEGSPLRAVYGGSRIARSDLLGEYAVVLDGLPFTADIQSEDAVFGGGPTPELSAAQRRASHRIFGADTERRFQPAGKALAAWYDVVSRQKPPG